MSGQARHRGRSSLSRASGSAGAQARPFAVIEHALRLAGGALERVRRDELHRHAHAGDGVDLPVDAVVQLLQLPHLVAEVRRAHLHLHDRLVERAGARDLDEVVRRGPLDAQQRLLDLRREDVHAADDEHVVGAAHHPAHAHAGAPARAGRAVERGEVAGAVAEHRHRLLGERREHELAHLAVRDVRERVGVDALDEEVVLLRRACRSR